MDVSALTQQYRICREKQRTELQLVGTGKRTGKRTGFSELSDAISIVPVSQGWTSSWEPSSPSPPVVYLDSDQKMSDPWRVHLDLHRRRRPVLSTQMGQRTCRRSCSPASKVRSSNPSPSDCFCSFSDSDLSSQELPVGADPGSGVSDGSGEGYSRDSRGGQGSPYNSPWRTTERVSQQPGVHGSRSSFTRRDQNQQENQSSGTSGSQNLQTSCGVSEQLSAGGGSGSSQNPYPFPTRRTPKISEAARSLGLY
ncbi:uncharacterized protein LOC119777280 isoform X2 [Cyprinodon tularosa]|uniref:uncharacterized protein LOC119777280 isoform X2 n=1 Tax=Cyprinodon tularosa TaxID=77115 RepID=UPI0018E20F63|nr:uncharacterized protein LOC119777280 isoform X2 [Cyprinodon tularosa]